MITKVDTTENKYFTAYLKKKNDNRKSSFNICRSNIKEYTPLFYRPIISFKGEATKDIFPESLLKISEKEFDKCFINKLNAPAKREIFFIG